MERTIKVSATGFYRAAPDLTRATVRLSGQRETYEQAAEAFECSFALLKKEAGEKFCLNTTDFCINTHYVEERGQDNTWSRRFAGYLFYHTLSCEFGFDRKKLGEFVSLLSRCECVDSFGLDYALSDSEKPADSACAQAVRNATAKAVTLADAAGVRLGEIVSVDFLSSAGNVGAARMYKMNDRAAVMSASLEFSPSELVVAATVEMCWELV